MWACNLPRHGFRVHGITPPEGEDHVSETTDSESSSVQSKWPQPSLPKSKASSKQIQRTQPKPSSSTTAMPPSNDYIMIATLCMLRRTEGVNITDLSQYLRVYFHKIPKDWREPMIITCFAAAQRVATAHVETILGTDEKRGPYLNRSMARWLNRLTYMEPGYSVYHSDSSSGNSTTNEAYSPTSNFLLNRKLPVPLKSKFLRRQLDLELQSYDNGATESATSVQAVLTSVALEQTMTQTAMSEPISMSESNDAIERKLVSVDNTDSVDVTGHEPVFVGNQVTVNLGVRIDQPSEGSAETVSDSNDVTDRVSGFTESVKSTSFGSVQESPKETLVSVNVENGVSDGPNNASVRGPDGDEAATQLPGTESSPEESNNIANQTLIHTDATIHVASPEEGELLTSSSGDVIQSSPRTESATEYVYSDVEPMGATTKGYRKPIKKVSAKGPPKQSMQLIDLTDDVEMTASSSVKLSSATDCGTQLFNANRAKPATVMTNRGWKTNAVAATTVLSSKPVASREKVRKDGSGVSATVKQNEIDSPISDASSDFDVGSATSNKASSPLPAILTPTQTPSPHDEENEETAFKLHPSPTPTIEESAPTMDAHPEATLPIRIPKGAKSAKQ